MSNRTKRGQDIYPILAIDEPTQAIISVNADMTVAFEILLPEIFTFSEGDYDNLHDTFSSAMKILPTGYIFHKQDYFINEPYQPDMQSKFVREGNFLAFDNEMHFAERPFLCHRCFVYITRPAADVKKRTSLNSSLLKRHVVPKEVLNPTYLSDFMEVCERFEYLLKNSPRLKVRRLIETDIKGAPNQPGLLQNYSSLAFDDNTLYELTTDKDGSLMVGEKKTYTFVISELSDFPTVLYNSAVYEPYSSDKFQMPVSTASPVGLGLPFSHLLNQVIVIENNDQLRLDFTGQIKRLNSFAEWSTENQATQEFKAEFLQEISRGGRIPVKSHYNVVVWDTDPTRAETYRSMTASALSSMGFTPRQAKSDAATLYWSCIPGNIAEIGVDNLLTSFLDQAICLLTFETNYNDSPYSNTGIKMTDRFGKPVMVDLFHEPMKKGLISNRNVFIVGPSGSGKSFFTNNMIYYMLTSGMHVSIVDVGHSYRRLCEMMGGRYITYDVENPISFNPFYFPTAPTEEEKDALAELLKSLWKTEHDLVSNAEQTTLANLVHNYFVHLNKMGKDGIYPCFNSFYEFTRDHYSTIFEENGGRHGMEFDLPNFLYVLKPFYQGGQYDYLLNSTTNVDLFDLPFVVYELDNIKDHPVLFPVTTIMIMNSYVRKLFTVKGVLKALIIEEAWKALTKDKFANFLKWASKTVRKHYGSLAVVTQELDDLIGSSIVKDALINNSDIKILLDQKNYENRFDEVAALLGLGQKESTLVQSVNRSIDPKRPPYREVCVFLKNYGKVYGVEVSKSGYAAFTTERSEVEIMEALRRSYNGTLTDAVRAYARGERI